MASLTYLALWCRGPEVDLHWTVSWSTYLWPLQHGGPGELGFLVRIHGSSWLHGWEFQWTRCKLFGVSWLCLMSTVLYWLKQLQVSRRGDKDPTSQWEEYSHAFTLPPGWRMVFVVWYVWLFEGWPLCSPFPNYLHFCFKAPGILATYNSLSSLSCLALLDSFLCLEWSFSPLLHLTNSYFHSSLSLSASSCRRSFHEC